jgi:hypothetical protein
MRIARWTPKITNTHSDYVILIAFPQPQWLHEQVSVSGYIDIDIDIDISVNCNWVDTLWQYTFTHKQYTEHHN